MVDAINQTGAAWASYFWMLNWQNSLFVAIALLLMHRYRRAHPRFGRIVGIIALVKLLTPLFIPAGQAISDSLGFGYFGDAVVVAGENGPAETLKLSLSGSLFLLWLGGAALMLTIIAWRYLRLLSLAQNALPMPDAAWKSGAFPTVSARRSQKAHSPFVIGFLRFRIVFPRSAADWPAEQIRAAFAHEIAHIKLHDHWINLAQALVQSIYFLNPLVWLLNRQLNDAREIACDEAAVALLQQSPAGYARSLMNIASKLALPQTFFLTPLFFAASSRNLKNRISYQLEQKENPAMKKWTLRHIVIALSFGILAFPLSCNYENPSSPQKPLSRPPAVEISQGRIVAFQDLTEKPVEIVKSNPQYPAIAKAAGIEGKVFVKALIGTHGLIEQVEVLKSVPELDAAAIEAAWQFKFKPGKVDGERVKVWVTIPFHFKLDGEKKTTGARGEQPRILKNAAFQLEELTEPPDWLALYDQSAREDYNQRIERQFSQPIKTVAYQNGERKASVINIIFNVLVGRDGMPEKVEIDKISGPLDQGDLNKMAKNIAHFNYGVGKREGVPVKYWMKILRGVVNPNIR